jgi:TolB-like protein/class 3 adenylate cyclase
MERKLTAILAADVVGYSRLMEADEAGTLTRLKGLLKDIFEPKVAEHHGRVVKTTGDGVLVEFPSVVEAVQCGVEVERANALRNADVPDDRRIEIRMGINLGDVIADGGDIYGDGVNVAARLEGMAEPGGICISGAVLNQVKNKVELRVEDLGSHRVKNIAEPLPVYRVVIDAGAGKATPARRHWPTFRPWHAAAVATVVLLLAAGSIAAWYLQPPETSPSRSFPAIAVLPFNNFSGNPAQDYLGDGVAEEIITMLSRFPDLAVIARNSTFTYKGKAVDVRQVGRDLNADYVLEGSVRNEGQKLRITAQLIDAGTGQHVWAERYEDSGSDPWSLQDEVTTKIITSLTGDRGLIRKKEYEEAWGKDTINLGEYDYYLRGHDLMLRLESKETNERAGEILREGLAKFPESSLLRAKLGFFHLVRGAFYWSDDAPADFRRATELAREALSDQHASPQTRRISHWVLADTLGMTARFEQALNEAQAAIALAPYDANMLADLSNVPARTGKPDLALNWLQDAMRRDPHFERYWSLSFAYYVKGDYEHAIDAATHLNPDWQDRYVLLASSYVRLGRMDEARAAVKQLLELDPHFSQARLPEGGYSCSDPTILARQQADLGKAGLPEK